MSRILYLAELFKKLEWEPVLCTTPNNFDREDNIYFFDTAQNLTSYWVTTWDGFFDTPIGTDIQVFFDLFLFEVSSEALLKSTINSFFVSGDLVFVNIPRKPWQYFKSSAQISSSESTSYSTGPKNSADPSDIKYDGKKYLPILKVPSINNKLSDPISGISLFPTFSYQLDNNDGRFDNDDEFNFFNTPTFILKSFEKDNPSISDFKTIRRGLVEFVKPDFKKYFVTVADYDRFFTNEITRVFTVAEFPNIEDNVINKNIPIGYGSLVKIPLFQIDKDTAPTPTFIDYVAIEPTQVFSVSSVFDSDGNSLSFTLSSGIIRVTELDGGGEVIPGDSVTLEGKQGFFVGSIITELINDFSNFKYFEGNWDVTETDAYIAISDEVGFYFKGGQLKKAVTELLKNDSAFLITKNDGRLTIRRWGETYGSHTIDSWRIFTDKLKKNSTSIAKYYASSININYNKIVKFNSFNDTFLNDDNEIEIFEKFKRSVTSNYNTILINEADVSDLSDRLLNRFGNMNNLVSVSVGYDTSEINLLDTVNIDIVPNGRVFSDFAQWIVRQVNPSQDSLLLEPANDTKITKAILDNLENAILDNEENAILAVN